MDRLKRECGLEREKSLRTKKPHYLKPIHQIEKEKEEGECEKTDGRTKNHVQGWAIILNKSCDVEPKPASVCLYLHSSSITNNKYL